MIGDSKLVPIVEFAELKPKTYSFVKNNGVVDWNAKEINKNVVIKMNYGRFSDK